MESKMTNYIKYIDDQIDEHRQKIKELEAAKRVLARIDGVVAKKPVKKMEPRAPLRQEIKDLLAKADRPLMSRDIIDQLDMRGREARVWTMLSDMAKAGSIGYDQQTRLYSHTGGKNNAAGE
jgi:hypothetical protein